MFQWYFIYKMSSTGENIILPPLICNAYLEMTNLSNEKLNIFLFNSWWYFCQIIFKAGWYRPHYHKKLSPLPSVPEIINCSLFPYYTHFIYSTLPFGTMVWFPATKWLHLLYYATNWGNKDTFFSAILKVGKSKLPLFLGFNALLFFINKSINNRLRFF